MRLFLFSLILILFFAKAFNSEKNLRKDEYCKESLFNQFFFKKCTPRNFLLDKSKQINI